MPGSGVNRIIAGELTLQKKKGKALVKAQDEAFDQKKILEKGRSKGNRK
jgi:hypothetical protein